MKIQLIPPRISCRLRAFKIVVVSQTKKGPVHGCQMELSGQAATTGECEQFEILLPMEDVRKLCNKITDHNVVNRNYSIDDFLIK